MVFYLLLILRIFYSYDVTIAVEGPKCDSKINAFKPWAFFQQSWHGTCIPYYFKVISKNPRLLHLLLHQAFGNRSITVYTCFIDLKSFFATLVRTTISLMRGKRFINSAYNSSTNLSFYRILKDGKEWKANAIFKRQCPLKRNVIKSSKFAVRMR